jgi:site-specific DNA recombinase
MTATWSQKRGRRYRYYVCLKAHRRGWATCPSRSVPATEIERFVVDRIRAVGQDPDLIEKTAEQAGRQLAERKAALDGDARQIRSDLQKAYRDLRGQLSVVRGNGKPMRSPDTLSQQETIRELEARLAFVLDEKTALIGRRIDASDLREALHAFDPVWDHLTTPEQARVVQLLIERIDYDGAKGSMAITFRPSGVRTLATETATDAGATP